MHVLQLSWEFPPHVVGGMGRHVAELTPALVGVGARVSVITPLLRGGLASEPRSAGLEIHRVELAQPPNDDYPAFVVNAGRALEQAAYAVRDAVGQVDLLHAHDWLTADVACRLKHDWRVPLVATVHATERGRGRGYLNGSAAHQINSLEWRLTYEAWRVIVCSHFMAGQMADYFATPADKIDVVPNGVALPPNPFANQDERLAFRRRYAADDEGLVFHVGRIVYEKGLQTLIDAWPYIASTRARLVIAGTGDYLESLKIQVTVAGLADQVHFTGFVSDAERDRIYHCADLAVFPSLYEPFGIVALEAFAAGCPLVVSDAGGLSEVVQHGQSGLVVQAGNVDALAAAVLACLDGPEQARARAERAREIVRARYSWEPIAAETLAVYRRVQQEWQAGSWGK